MNQALEAQAYTELLQLYAEYTAAIDAGDWDRWPEFFTEDCIYKLQPRENHERGLPLATLHFHSKGMLQDRVYGIRETLFHDPYYQRHVVSLPRVLSVDGGRWFWERAAMSAPAWFGSSRPSAPLSCAAWPPRAVSGAATLSSSAANG